MWSVSPEAVLRVTSGGRGVNPYRQSAWMLLSAMGTLSLGPPPIARHGKTGSSYKLKMVLPCFLYAESIVLSFSMHCEIECYLQLKRSTDNEFFSESNGNGMYGVMTLFLEKKKKKRKEKRTGSQLGDGFWGPSLVLFLD